MNQERRRFFRIEDIVELKAEAIEPQEIDDRLKSFWNDQHQFSIRNEFNFKIEQHQADLKKIKNSMPELGRYLSMLQDQIDLLTDRLTKDEADFSQLEKQVNISAQGISYYSAEEIKLDDIVELQLKLMPNGQQIVIFARVIQCENADHEQGKYKISLDFEHIHEADREILVKHIHGKQMKAFGAARFEEDNSVE